MPPRLIKVSRGDLTLTRQRRGKGFCYLAADGSLVCEPEAKTRIKALGIPPAWHDVRIAHHPRAHIQVLGVDNAGHEQYIYHPDWERKRESKKQRRLALLTGVLPRLRRRVNEHLKAEAGSRELALAIAVALIDKTAMRLGREKYLEANGTRGAGTLYSRDVTVSADEITMKFDAKGGKRAEYSLRDKALADAIARIKTLPGKRLLVYRGEDGKVTPIRTPAINLYLREQAGVEISAKDFRTLHASALAAEALAQVEDNLSESARRRQMSRVAREVSQVLRNTPVICRKSYIAPGLFKLFNEGKLKALWNAGGKGRPGLLTRERRLAEVLATVS